MLRVLSTTALIAFAAPAFAEPVAYKLDPSHSQIVFGWTHLGFSTTYAMFSGFEGDIMFDEADPENSSVEVTIPVQSMFTGWEARYEHMMGGDFFDAAEGDAITFTSTAIEVTGENTAKITGDLTLGDETTEVVLDATMNKSGEHPMNGETFAGFDATTTFMRSELGLGGFTPAVGDDVTVMISVEAERQ